MLKYVLPIFFWLICSLSLQGQQATVLEKGVVTYVSSQNVYVKYASTEGISKGDTLFLQTENELVPCLVVKDKSSTSCVCISMLSEKVKVGEEFFARVPKKEAPKPVVKAKKGAPQMAAQDSLSPSAPLVITPESDEIGETDFKQKIKGRLSAASYSNFYGGREVHRMRYAFTMQGRNLGNSRFSAENYITFRHKVGEWDEVKGNLNHALKIFSLALKYDGKNNASITLGRKINQRISSMGAIDGMQVEKGLGNFLLGGIAGSRPDFADYGLNFNLMQAGAYLGHASQSQQSTFAFIEQRNLSKTDRRFLYLQHSNTLLKNMNVFASMEIDLYKNIHNEAGNTLSLTNLFLSLRYKVSKKISVSASYDNRKNIIYYESFKSYIDQLIDIETRQGLRFNVNYRPLKFVTWGANASWRFQKSDMNLSKNLNSYLNISRIPWIKASVSLTANFLQTHYLNSKIVGIRLSREIIPGKLNSDMYFRMVDYSYKNYEQKIRQKIAGMDVSFNLTRKLGFHIYYEGTFDERSDTFHRLNTKIIQRL